jgi:deferrochelatase/peroxidase EfeB
VRRVPVHEQGPRRTYRGYWDSPIAAPQRSHAALGIYDAPDLEAWPEIAATLDGVTVVLGVGPGVLDPGPVALAPLPAFAGDELRHEGGGACVLIFSDTPTDALRRFGTPRYTRTGTHAERGALGFRDGTSQPRRPIELDRHVFVQRRDREYMVGGTYLVVRDIHVNPSWHALATSEKEHVIGRDMRAGVPLHGRRLFEKPDLTKLPEHSHIRQASPRTSNVTILRRGYDTPQGLLLLAFMQDPRRQFVPLQRRLAAHDALHAHTTTKASAVFAIPANPSLYAQ